MQPGARRGPLCAPRGENGQHRRAKRFGRPPRTLALFEDVDSWRPEVVAAAAGVNNVVSPILPFHMVERCSPRHFAHSLWPRATAITASLDWRLGTGRLRQAMCFAHD